MSWFALYSLYRDLRRDPHRDPHRDPYQCFFFVLSLVFEVI